MMPAAMICPNSVKRSSSVVVSMGEGLSPLGERCIRVQSLMGLNSSTGVVLEPSQHSGSYWFSFVSSAAIVSIMSSNVGGVTMNISVMAS